VTWTFTTVDTTPPTVTQFSPLAGEDNVSADTDVTVTFSEAMDEGTVNASTVELRDPSNAMVPATVSYNAASLTATLNPDASLSAGVTYTARVKGGSADQQVKDVAGNALAANVTWTFTIVDPPQIVSRTPAPGSTNESIGVAPAAKFSEALDETSLDETTVLLTDADAPDNPIPVNVSYEASTFTVTLTPQQLLQRGQTYTVTLKGGPDEPHITDTTGTPLASNTVWSFTTAFSIFAPTDKPAGDPPVANQPGFAIELGHKFRSEMDGLITGVRFYKVGPANSGEHVGKLYNSAGTLLGSVNFANETGSGWQQAIFENPIPIAANTTYIVSYFAPEGNYAATGGQFALEGKDNPPLHALMNGVDGGNGVFREGGGFPNSTFNSTNYWVDVVFNDSGPLPPQVLSVTPARDATNVPTDIEPSATFSEPLAPGSVNGSTVLLTDEDDNPVPVDISYESSDFKVRIIPQQPLQLGQTYTVTLKGAPNAPHITDATGAPLAADYTWSFTTESPPELTQVTMLGNWVTAGANFIAMRPDKRLAYLLGISGESSVRSEAYLRGDNTRELGAGIVIKRLAVESVRLP
jgi:hypothetical protein